MLSQKHVDAAVGIAMAMAEAIRDLGQVPAGHLYAMVCSKVTLQQFDSLIAVLARSGLVRREASHLLVWTGPAIA